MPAVPAVSSARSGGGDAVAIDARAAGSMLRHCAAAYPLEACGVLASLDTREGTPPVIMAAYAVGNAASRPAISFAFEPESWIRACYDMQRNRQSLAGFYHSHPQGSQGPSISDLAGLPPLIGGTYWIVSSDPDGTEAPRLQAYRITRREDAEDALMLAEIRIEIA